MGAAYRDRIKGDKSENIQKAIVFFEAALEVFTPAELPINCLITARSLGNLLFGLEHWQEAISTYDKAIQAIELICSWATDNTRRKKILEDNIDIYKTIVQACIKNEQPEKALEYAKRSKARNLVEFVRHEEYFQLIKKLLSYSTEEELKKTITDNLELFDAGFLQMLEAAAQMVSDNGYENDNLFGALVNAVKKALGLSIIKESLESLKEAKFQPYGQFLAKVLQATIVSKGDAQVVYPLLSANIDKLDVNLAEVLRLLATSIFEEAEEKDAKFIGFAIANFSRLIQEFPLGDKANNMEIAITGYKVVLTIFTKDASPQDWAVTQNNLGTAYNNRIKGNKADNIEQAINSFQDALTVKNRKDFPQDWALTQINLGNAYNARIKGNKADNIEQAINNYRRALTVYTRKNFPYEWAKTQINLGAAYRERIKGNKADNIEKAINSYQHALNVHTRKDFPDEWATIQNNLGISYNNRIKGNKADNIEKAINSYQHALNVHTRKDFPQDWARTQSNLGNAYNNRIKGDKADNIEQAINNYRHALTVHTRKDFSQSWAMTQINLGIAYNNRIKGNKADNIEQAINNYRRALTVYTRKDFPQNWAATQNNLGAAYRERIKGNKADNIEKAINNYRRALTVYTRKDFPQDWARTQSNLGNAYSVRIKEDKTDNIKQAINSYQHALTIFIPTVLPIDCLRTAGNFGRLLLKLKRWQEAINAYHKAIQAVELSRSSAAYDSRRQQILEDAFSVYADIIQACINNKQPALAIEYAERSKARNLVELLSTRDLYPKGDIPQEIINELDRLRKKIRVEQIYLSRQAKSEVQGDNKDENQIKAENQKWESSRQHLEQLQQQLDKLIKNQIQPIDPGFSLSHKVESIHFKEIQSLLDERTTIVEWYITKEKIIAFIITPKTIIAWQSQPENRKALSDWINEYLGYYYDEDKKSQWQNELKQRLSKLAEIIHIEEIITQIPKECDRLILIPHRFLHILPLHALEIKNSESSINQCLLELFPGGVTYAPSCQLLQLTKNQQRNDFISIFAIQTPTEDLYEEDLGAVTAIKKQFTDSYVLKKASAKKSSILSDEKFLKANNAFFFCHGYFNSRFPLDSGLILADGNLTLDDLFTTVKLENCRLVTISACETGLIDFANISDEYIGLPSGFIFAGSTNVISSLWKVSAVATALLMIKFYEELQQQNSIVLALNKAQLWLRDTTAQGFQNWLKKSSLSLSWRTKLEQEFANYNATTKVFESPYFWSAFCAIGKGE